MTRAVRIGNAHGFWGDRLEAAAEMLSCEPELDFLTLDFLAEVSMSILAVQRARDPDAGWPRDFLEIVRGVAPYWRRGGRCRIVTNAGGLSPLGCARACREVLRSAGCADRAIAVVSGDDVLDQVRGGDTASALLRNLDTGQPIAEVRSRLLTANAYLGAEAIADVLARGADLVITGRVADPSLTVGPCADWFGWTWDDWDRLAGATVAGHLIECGTQATGGISSQWLHTPGLARIGFPIVEVAADGSCTLTKTRGSGGRVDRQVVREQLLYEMADPGAYLSPDVTVSLLGLSVDEEGIDRVRVKGARGRPPPPTYKVSATYADGFRAQGQLTVFGAGAVAKARRAGQAVLERLRSDGVCLRESLVECLGSGACWPARADPAAVGELRETVLRIAVADDSREALERFTRALMPLVTAGPPGTTGYAEGRPRIHPMFRFWPCLIPRQQVQAQTEILSAESATGANAGLPGSAEDTVGQANRGNHGELAGPPSDGSAEASVATAGQSVKRACPRRLGDIAWARSGDKGIHANIGVIARRAGDFPRLCREVTAARVAAYFGLGDAGRVTRYELPNLEALNLVIRGILANPLQVDAQGKALAQALLDMPLATTIEDAMNNNDSVLIVERPDEVTAILTLSRPERRNALSIQLMQSLCEALQSLAAEPQRRVVILRGAGPAFCAGLDLYEAAGIQRAEESAQWVARTFQALAASPLVSIAAAHGAAYAGGAGLLACCDLAVAADGLRIAFPEARRGLVPALAAVALRERLRGGDLAELLLLGEPIDAAQALGMGLVQRVVPGDCLLAEAQKLAALVLQGGPNAVRQTKLLLRETRGTDPGQSFQRALEFHQRARLSDEAQEGLAAFREHRGPRWPDGKEDQEMIREGSHE
jgi:enoyl-CoA hydratase/carnithine racemase